MTETSYQIQESISRRLLGWAIPDLAVGLLLLGGGWVLTRELGLQALVWGIVNASIALAGLWSSRRKSRQRDAGVLDASADTLHLSKLHRVLLVNTWLDLGYMGAGAWLLASGSLLLGPGTRGHGIGILLQGTFLFIFDLLYTIHTRKLIYERAEP